MFFLKNKLSVAVHSGNFHADDLFSVATLSLYLGYIPKIIRTRDLEKIKNADFALDVGGEYNPEEGIFDHHQDGGAGKRENGIPYAAFGLIWKEFGEKVSGSREAQELIDKKLVQVMDATDNAFELNVSVVNGVIDYSLRDYLLYVNMNCETDKERDRIFSKMVIFAKEILEMEIKFAKAFVKEKNKVLSAYENMKDKKVIVLDEDCSNWNEILSDYAEPLLVVKPSPTINAWKVYCVKIKGEKFKNRTELPKSWASKKDGELVKITGVSDAIYCHHSGYMAIAKTKDGALKLAELAVKNA